MSSVLFNQKKVVFKCAMKGRWKEVVKKYEEDWSILGEHITRSGDSVLHIAVSEGKDDVVERMVNHLVKIHDHDDPQNNIVKKILETKNQRDNTALHLAASLGNVRMCHLIASIDPLLVDCRNVDGETPLFLAALHGKKQAFFCLHFIRNPPTSTHREPNYVNCRRNDGDTILHRAIYGDNLDMAFQIIRLYKGLVNSVNEDGLSPLHLLAAKPSAFRSGSRLGRIEKLIYYCIYVEKLEVEDPKRFQSAGKVQAIAKNYPQNYNTCFSIFSVIGSAAVLIKEKIGPAAVLIKEKIRSAAESALGRKKAQAHGDGDQDPEKANPETSSTTTGSEVKAQRHEFLPANYSTLCGLVKFLYVILMIILGQGSNNIKKLRRKKERHVWSVQIMDELLECASYYEYDDNGSQPGTQPKGYGGGGTEESSFLNVYKPSTTTEDSGKKDSGKRIYETPILIAAKNGVTEMVKKIVELFPVAIYDMNEEKKNIVLLAVEKRQPHVYQLLQAKNIFRESLFRQVDNEGNSALHLAAKHGRREPWLIAGAALQMQSEIKWFEFVKNSMPPHFFVRYNKNFQTPKDIFIETHSEMVQSGGEWMTKTSESCSLVATLVATVAFASATTVPGGVGESGEPPLENEPMFNLFVISSLVALCFSITSTLMFLSILTSRYQEFDFNKDLPLKLILGLSSLFLSIAFMLVSFCAGHYFVLNHHLRYDALPIYVVTSFPVTLFALAQFPLYFDLLWATFANVPKRSYKATPAMEYVSSPKEDNIKSSKQKTE